MHDYENQMGFAFTAEIKGWAQSKVDAFRKKVRDWWLQVVALAKDKRPLSPALQAEKKRILKRAKFIRATIEKMGAGGFMKDLPNVQIAGVGAVPVVAGAAALGVLGMIAYNVSDITLFSKKAAAYTASVKAGATPQEAATSVSRLFHEGTPMRFDTKLILAAVALGGLWIFLNKKGG